MSKQIPTIQKYMTMGLFTIAADQTLAEAQAMLREHHIRHLPVLRGTQLVGMLTERDVMLVATFKDVDPRQVRAEDAMSHEVYAVSPEAKLDEVVKEMASKKYGSAMVVQNGKVVGLFTTVDACRALSELLHDRLAH